MALRVAAAVVWSAAVLVVVVALALGLMYGLFVLVQSVGKGAGW